MWKLMRLALLVWSAAFLAVGCTGLRKSKKAAGTGDDQPVLIGMIEMINPEQNYVLIRAERVHALPAGAELIAIDASGKQARLALTPERKGVHLTADIKEGSPKVLNLVIYQPKGSRSTAVAPAVAAQTPPLTATTAEPTPTPMPMPVPAVGHPEAMKIDPIPLEPAPPSLPKPVPASPAAPSPR